LKLNFSPQSIFKIRNKIYVNNIKNFCEIDMKNLSCITKNDPRFYSDIISSNDNYICVYDIPSINIYSINMEFVGNISTDNSLQNFIIDNNNSILVSFTDKFCIHNLEGEIINSWKLNKNKKNYDRTRYITNYGNEIFMTDTNYNRICVFSYEGNLIRSWGKFGNDTRDLNYPTEIIIYKNLIFVIDLGNFRIQVLIFLTNLLRVLIMTQNFIVKTL
jgi:hypothetical protein